MILMDLKLINRVQTCVILTFWLHYCLCRIWVWEGDQLHTVEDGDTMYISTSLLVSGNDNQTLEHHSHV